MKLYESRLLAYLQKLSAALFFLEERLFIKVVVSMGNTIFFCHTGIRVT